MKIKQTDEHNKSEKQCKSEKAVQKSKSFSPVCQR